MALGITLRRILYQRPFSKLMYLVVSLLEASSPSRLDNPTTPPPQPPTIMLHGFVPTGKVRAQKKSLPSTRIASSSTSKFIRGISFVHVTPVITPLCNTIRPSVTRTSPRPAKSVIVQPVRVLPSNKFTQSLVSGKGFPAACFVGGAGAAAAAGAGAGGVFFALVWPPDSGAGEPPNRSGRATIAAERDFCPLEI